MTVDIAYIPSSVVVRECKKCLMTKENRLFTDDVVVTSEDCDDVIRGIGT